MRLLLWRDWGLLARRCGLRARGQQCAPVGQKAAAAFEECWVTKMPPSPRPAPCPSLRSVRLEHAIESEYREVLQHHCRNERLTQQR